MSQKMYHAYISHNLNNKVNTVAHNPFYSDAFSLIIVILEMMGINIDVFT